MAKQYEVLKPFSLPFFRPVEVGELVTLDPDIVSEYDLGKSVREVKEAPVSEPTPE